MSRLMFPKLVLLQKKEFEWVNQIMLATQRDTTLKNSLKTRQYHLSLRILEGSHGILTESNGHCRSSFDWTMAICSNLINNKLQYESHILGCSHGSFLDQNTFNYE